MNCIHCNREINNKGSLKAHEIVCEKNPDRKKYVRSPKAGRQSGKTYYVWNRGLTKEIDDRLLLSSIVRSAKQKGKPGKPHSEQFKKDQSDRMKKRYSEGWEPVCGRCKKYDYESPIAGKIKVDGNWELEVAKYLDSIGVEWKRNKKRFQYINLNGNISTYQPDFVIQNRYYIEVKGYETDLDRCKWSQFQEHLTIFKKEQIDFIKSGGKPDGVWASLLS